MSPWNAREKKTRRFRSSRALKQDRAMDSQEPWEVKRKKKKGLMNSNKYL